MHYDGNTVQWIHGGEEVTKVEKQLIIGAEIRKARSIKKLRQIDLANEAGISRTYLSDLENGRYMPSIETISNIAKILNIDLNFLMVLTEIQV